MNGKGQVTLDTDCSSALHFISDFIAKFESNIQLMRMLVDEVSGSTSLASFIDVDDF